MDLKIGRCGEFLQEILVHGGLVVAELSFIAAVFYLLGFSLWYLMVHVVHFRA